MVTWQSTSEPREFIAALGGAAAWAQQRMIPPIGVSDGENYCHAWQRG